MPDDNEVTLPKLAVRVDRHDRLLLGDKDVPEDSGLMGWQRDVDAIIEAMSEREKKRTWIMIGIGIGLAVTGVTGAGTWLTLLTKF